MKWKASIFGALLLGGCVSSDGLKLSDEERANCRGENPSVVVFGVAACMEFGRVQRMRGVYYAGPEEGRFVAGDSRINREPAKDDVAYADPTLWVDDEALFEEVGDPKRVPGCSRAVYVDFDGRGSIRHVPGSARSYFGDRKLFTVIKMERLRKARFLGYVRAMNTDLQIDCSKAGQ